MIYYMSSSPQQIELINLIILYLSTILGNITNVKRHFFENIVHSIQYSLYLIINYQRMLITRDYIKNYAKGVHFNCNRYDFSFLSWKNHM